MHKILGSWSGMRNYLEQEMLAESLRGRVRYNSTSFPGMDGCRLFEIYLDGALAKRFAWETVNSDFIRRGKKERTDPHGTMEYWAEFWPTLSRIPVQEREEHTDGEFCDALERYRNQPIADSLESENPLERMFAILDRRVGKRRLAAISKTVEQQPQWLKRFYRLRLEAEGIPVEKSTNR